MSIHPENHAECAPFLKTRMRLLGADVSVSDLPPLVQSPYNRPGDGNGSLTCPHGTTFYFEPTGDQIAQWVRDGVE